MPSFVSGNIVIGTWRVLDASGAPLTGQTVPTNVTLALLRQSGSVMIAASEAIAWTEIGATGDYYFSFTPENNGLYHLHLREITPPLLRQHVFEWQVVPAGSIFAPAYADAFCSESDVERWLQQAIDGTSKPNDTETAGFAVSRAAVLMSLCAGLGFTVTPATVTAGSRLEHLLREANAIGAALDYTIAQVFGDRPSSTERITALATAWREYAGGAPAGSVQELPGFIENEIRGTLVSLATDHILSGDTIAHDEGDAPTSLPIGITMGDLY